MFERDAARKAASRIERRFDGVGSPEERDAGPPPPPRPLSLRAAPPRSPGRSLARQVEDAGRRTAELFGLDETEVRAALARTTPGERPTERALGVVLDVRRDLRRP